MTPNYKSNLGYILLRPRFVPNSSQSLRTTHVQPNHLLTEGYCDDDDDDDDNAMR